MRFVTYLVFDLADGFSLLLEAEFRRRDVEKMGPNLESFIVRQVHQGQGQRRGLPGLVEQTGDSIRVGTKNPSTAGGQHDVTGGTCHLSCVTL
ncbi:hypothetical protein CEXT_783261 [Caerostris extrusa]|uniref:Uncharacterized protein n=1 Tax=Caerostris extrusa TaxID=172846 RepID=A0AAV4XXD3_CAEEX|nr:hypothetical protein CEXT_783261 [Caerostris extrusa]